MICFFDTNVLVYAVDAGDPARRERALERLARAARDDTVVLSTQVLQEFYAIVTRRFSPPMSRSKAAEHVQRLCAFQIMGSTAQSVRTAIALSVEHQMHWWDALILEAALRAGADLLISEDGQSGRRYGELAVENPFSVPRTPPSA